MELIKKKENLDFLDEKLPYINQLEIIMTQKCNLSCAHCMRGDAKNHTISQETLDSIFEKIVGTNNLSLGGGEPSLSPETIVYLTNALKKHNSIVTSVNFTLNGTIYSPEFVSAVKSLEEYIIGLRKQVGHKQTNDEFTPIVFCFSFDNYHMEELHKKGYSIDEIWENVLKYRTDFPNAHFALRDGANFSVINEGRAKTLHDNTPKVLPPSTTYPILKGRKTNIIGNIFVISCDGEVVPVNTSFENEKTLSAGNIKTDSIKTIMKRLKTKTFDSEKQFVNFDNKELVSKFYVTKSEIRKFFKKPENKKVYYQILAMQDSLNSKEKE